LGNAGGNNGRRRLNGQAIEWKISGTLHYLPLRSHADPSDLRYGVEGYFLLIL